MSDSPLDAALREIRARLQVAEREIEALRAAERGLALLTTKGEKSPYIPTKTSKSGGITNAIGEALAALGHATSGEVITYVRKHVDPHANKNSVRSILSVGRKEGRFLKDGDRYSIRSAGQSLIGDSAKGGGA